MKWPFCTFPHGEFFTLSSDEKCLSGKERLPPCPSSGIDSGDTAAHGLISPAAWRRLRAPRVRDAEALCFQMLHRFDFAQRAASPLPLRERSAPWSRESGSLHTVFQHLLSIGKSYWFRRWERWKGTFKCILSAKVSFTTASVPDPGRNRVTESSLSLYKWQEPLMPGC